MKSTYVQKSSALQKVSAQNAASVLDASSQSKSLQRKVDCVNASSPGTTIQMARGVFTRRGDFQGNERTPVTRINPERLETLLENTTSSRGELGRIANTLLNQGCDILAGLHEGGIGGQGRGADPSRHITVRSGGHAYHIKVNAKGVVYDITG